MYDYDKWPNFSKGELVCQHTGKENPNIEEFSKLMDRVQELRDWYGRPMYVNSTYRSPSHPIEAHKAKPGQHSIAAIDFRVPPEDCHMVMKKAFDMGFGGIGVNLVGSYGSRFIHLDMRDKPWAWSYP